MPSILPIGYIDVSYLTALLLTKRKPMLEGGVIHVTDALLGEWPTLKKTCVALAGLATRVNDGVVPRLAKVTIERLKPLEIEDWAKGDGIELVLPLVVCPGMVLYAEADTWGPLPGAAFARLSGVLWSLANHGTAQSILLRARIDGDRDELPASFEE